MTLHPPPPQNTHKHHLIGEKGMTILDEAEQQRTFSYGLSSDIRFKSKYRKRT